jgi:hypothetical protein
MPRVRKRTFIGTGSASDGSDVRKHEVCAIGLVEVEVRLVTDNLAKRARGGEAQLLDFPRIAEKDGDFGRAKAVGIKVDENFPSGSGHAQAVILEAVGNVFTEKKIIQPCTRPGNTEERSCNSIEGLRDALGVSQSFDQVNVVSQLIENQEKETEHGVSAHGSLNVDFTADSGFGKEKITLDDVEDVAPVAEGGDVANEDGV